MGIGKRGSMKLITKYFFTALAGLMILSHPGFCQENDTLATDTVTGEKIRKYKPQLYPGFGGALVRNDLAPSFHIYLGFRYRDRYEANVNTSSMFFFEKGTDSRYLLHRNTFLNAEFVLNFNPLSKNMSNWNGVGVGYLIEARGRHFSETTVQIYYKRKFRFLTVMPAIVFDDNLKDVWPMITIRL
jgi:hypothetical protein